MDLTKCPGCGKIADRGHDRCDPPAPYFCTKCEKKDIDDIIGDTCDVIEQLEKENKELKEYVEHKYNCCTLIKGNPDNYAAGYSGECDCGLDKLLKELK